LQELSSKAFAAVIFQVDVFWIVTPCNVVVGYQRFRSLCLPNLLVWPLKCWYPTTTLNGVTTQKAT